MKPSARPAPQALPEPAKTGAAQAPDPYLAIACIVKPWGRSGEVAAEILTDFPERFRSLRHAYLRDRASPARPVTVERAWLHQGRVIVKFEGIDSIDQAGRLRGWHVAVHWRERAPLASRSYYVADLEGCRVWARCASGLKELGAVAAVEPTGGTDLLRVIRPGRREVLIPLAEEICPRIDLVTKTIEIVPLEGLLELND